MMDINRVKPKLKQVAVLLSLSLLPLSALGLTLTNADVQTIINQGSRPFTGNILIRDNQQTYVDLTIGEHIHADSRFLIGSISKTITATLVMRAVDQQKLSLNDDITEHLNIVTEHPITIAQLLNHTSGILPPKSPSLKARSQFIPGSQFSYSNYGYKLLGDILSQSDQKPYAELVNQFAKQYQLDISADVGEITDLYAQQPRLVHGFMEQQQQRVLLDEFTIDNGFIAFGAMQASSQGIAAFIEGLTQQQFLSATSLQAMTSPSAKRPHRWGELNYGYGLQISQLPGLVEYSHTGYLPGYISAMIYYPQTQLSVVILENTSWDLDNMERVFGLHDKIRQTIRNQIKTDD
ncbi:serine hydrolase domain-containing protein [Shewanella phaeophyticola]|uniref:Beta-lactamase family protein n=1 Tax=Shewanella phaeophyticola TaxID=2978345 RepID=A0ABT2P4Y2_9GAMM|nr:serine hydrolase domain-containing protein [Shewanella sp. KJ10-1]MCT8987517.1 beta-lactamase family protein [Shewanella sp. KJ10-1]